MSDTISIKPFNAARVKIDAEMHVYQGMYDHFAFRPEGYRWMPAFKNKQWDGFVRLFDTRSRTLPLGLIPRLDAYAKALGVSMDLSAYEDKSGDDEVTLEQVQEFANSLDIHAGGKKITPHDYQIDAVYMAIKTGRMIAIAPTSAGKSLILYMYVNWYLRNQNVFDVLRGSNKIMLIVPSVSLVHQMIGDFKDYASNNDRNPDDYCHLVTAGKEKSSDKPVTISTWQSLQGMVKNKQYSYFEQYNVVAVDEVHSAKGKVLSSILDLCTNAYNRLGVTGTLDGTDLMQIQLEGLFGPVYKVITTKELMERGAVSNLSIKCLMLTWSEEIKKLCKDLSYAEEVDYLVTHPKRLAFTANLAVSLDAKIHLEFGQIKIVVSKSADIPLSDGSVKKAGEITEHDDVCDEWIKSKQRS